MGDELGWQLATHGAGLGSTSGVFSSVFVILIRMSHEPFLLAALVLRRPRPECLTNSIIHQLNFSHLTRFLSLDGWDL